MRTIVCGAGIALLGAGAGCDLPVELQAEMSPRSGPYGSSITIEGNQSLASAHVVFHDKDGVALRERSLWTEGEVDGSTARMAVPFPADGPVLLTLGPDTVDLGPFEPELSGFTTSPSMGGPIAELVATGTGTWALVDANDNEPNLTWVEVGSEGSIQGELNVELPAPSEEFDVAAVLPGPEGAPVAVLQSDEAILVVRGESVEDTGLGGECVIGTDVVDGAIGLWVSDGGLHVPGDGGGWSHTGERWSIGTCGNHGTILEDGRFAVLISASGGVVARIYEPDGSAREFTSVPDVEPFRFSAARAAPGEQTLLQAAVCRTISAGSWNPFDKRFWSPDTSDECGGVGVDADGASWDMGPIRAFVFGGVYVDDRMVYAVTADDGRTSVQGLDDYWEVHLNPFGYPWIRRTAAGELVLLVGDRLVYFPDAAL